MHGMPSRCEYCVSRRRRPPSSSTTRSSTALLCSSISLPRSLPPPTRCDSLRSSSTAKRSSRPCAFRASTILSKIWVPVVLGCRIRIMMPVGLLTKSRTMQWVMGVSLSRGASLIAAMASTYSPIRVRSPAVMFFAFFPTRALILWKIPSLVFSNVLSAAHRWPGGISVGISVRSAPQSTMCASKCLSPKYRASDSAAAGGAAGSAAGPACPGLATGAAPPTLGDSADPSFSHR
mmetsp:Transcript_32839/g.99391  ORF Transcript_32839/g.99391 Transcript_32839/m.99391 type:complete len:234 (+) Transcript_32839:2496-3197(+)